LAAGLCPDPLGSLLCSPDPLAGFRGKGREGKEWTGGKDTGKEREGEGWEGREKGKRRY